MPTILLARRLSLPRQPAWNEIENPGRFHWGVWGVGLCNDTRENTLIPLQTVDFRYRGCCWLGGPPVQVDGKQHGQTNQDHQNDYDPFHERWLAKETAEAHARPFYRARKSPAGLAGVGVRPAKLDREQRSLLCRPRIGW